jgi:hypothetical protein
MKGNIFIACPRRCEEQVKVSFARKTSPVRWQVASVDDDDDDETFICMYPILDKRVPLIS